MGIFLKRTLFSLTFILYYLLLLFIFKNIEVVFIVFAITLIIVCRNFNITNLIYFNICFGVFIISPIFIEDASISITFFVLISILLSTIVGRYFKKINNIVIVLFISYIFILGIFGFKNLTLLEKNINSRERINMPEIRLKNGTFFKANTINNKIIVLDLWITSCGVCFKKFPDFEKMYFKYENNPLVELYTLNIPIRRDSAGQAEKMIGKFNYKFPSLFAKTDSLSKNLRIKRYPRLLIVKNGIIRFSGYPSINEKYTFFYNLDNEIEKLLNE